MTQPEISELINDIGNWLIGIIVAWHFCKGMLLWIHGRTR